MYKYIGRKTRDADAHRSRAAGFAPGLLRLALLAPVLSGCASVPASINPVIWWHDLQGGAIAEQRPPPPGATDPYPNLGTVPVRPAFTDPAGRARITEGLVADRAHAQYEQARSPLPDPSSPDASPGLFGGGTAPPAAAKAAATPPASDNAGATLDAASAPPPPAAPKASAPAGPVFGTSLAPPLATVPTAPGAPPPPLPTTPPPPPNLAGMPAGAGAPVPVVRTALAAAPTLPGEVAIAFVPASATLSAGGVAAVRAMAASRGSAPIVVTGRGEAVAADPVAQTGGLVLALARAQAIVAALTDAGVPQAAWVIDAQPAGRGAAIRLLK